MKTKPTVVYIESDSSGTFSENNYDKDALIYFLRNQCECEVLHYLWDILFEKDIEKIKRYYTYNHLMLVIVKQEDYSDQHEVVINLVRSLSKDTPIIVIPSWGEKRFKGNACKKLYAFHHSSKELISLVTKLRSEWIPSEDWLGVETSQGRAILTEQLKDAYLANHFCDDGMLGTPDYNHMIVAEALRIKLIPSDFIKEEFDDTIKSDKNNFAIIDDSVFKKEIKIIAQMNDGERKEFLNKLMRKMNREPCDSGGYVVTDVSCGSGVNGFAIDPITLETQFTYRFGEHHLAGQLLEYRVECIEQMLHNGPLSEDEELDCKSRIITGLIFSKVNGFSIPILRLQVNCIDKRTIDFLYSLKKFIPINVNEKIFKNMVT